MPKIREHEAVDTTYLRDARKPVAVRQEIPASAEELFGCLVDPDSWTRWFGFDDVVYTSPEPHGLGTTRTVHVLHNTIQEEFLAWQPGRRFCFRIARSTLPVAAMAEDYRIEPVDADHCVIEWRVALTGRPAFLAPLLRVALGVRGRMAFRKLAELLGTDRARYRPV